MPRIGDDLQRYLRTEMMPTVWCPGCGHGNIARAIASALEHGGSDPERVVLVGGIGCSGRTPFYFNTNAMHTTHGRALAFATGLKMARPDLKVVVVTGDGDALAIGGNHFIHAARRNLDVAVVLYNNSIYGMTGGQQAPTTPVGARSTTSLSGAIEPAFDAVELAMAAGATYVARTTTFDAQEMPVLIAEAIEHPGFALVEVLTQCPTYYGRLNRLGDAPEMLIWERDLTEPSPDPLTREQMAGGRRTGVFRREVRPEFTRSYAALCERLGAAADA